MDLLSTKDLIVSSEYDTSIISKKIETLIVSKLSNLSTKDCGSYTMSDWIDCIQKILIEQENLRIFGPFSFSLFFVDPDNILVKIPFVCKNKVVSLHVGHHKVLLLVCFKLYTRSRA